MKGHQKFLFDECIASSIMRKLADQVPSAPQFAHITEYFEAGVKDNDWIGKLKEEGGWVVITADRGKKGHRGAKLPSLCAQHRVTHLLIGRYLHHKPSHVKFGVLLSLWEQIASLHDHPPGTRFLLRFREAKGVARMVIEEQEVDPPKRR